MGIEGGKTNNDEVITCLTPETGETFDVGITDGESEEMSYEEICATISKSQEEELEERRREKEEIIDLMNSGEFKG